MSTPAGKEVEEIRDRVQKALPHLTTEEIAGLKKAVRKAVLSQPMINPFEGLEIVCQRCGFETDMKPRRSTTQPYTHYVWEFECSTCEGVTCIRKAHSRSDR